MSELDKLKINRAAPAPTLRRSRRRWPWVLLAAGLIVATAGFFSGRIGGSVAVETAAVVTAYPSQALAQLNATGYVVAQRKASLSSKATGRLEWLGVLEGSKVTKGEIIARLENSDVGAGREQTQAALKVAQANVEQGRAELLDAEAAYKRSLDLVGKKYISESAHDAAVARYNKAKASMSSLQALVAVARANLKSADVSVDQTVIRAPFDGIVLTKNANVGDNITPFSSAADSKGAVVTIADMDTLEVEADVSESAIGRIKAGQPCEIQLDAIPGERFAGLVSRTVPTVDRAKATVLVKVRFAARDARVLPDMSAKVAFLEREVRADETKPVTAVLPAAIVTRDGATWLYVLREDRVALTKVETGAKLGDLVEVRGVKAGERVALKPLDKLADGARVKPVQK
ncbi:MAG: efflux RND transporter periplasmic adaptor subunit [Proteobacteria bacterium]|nr:efflux RND transporter periplasmic adaptor subunit [Pseudomonadota bacterium]